MLKVVEKNFDEYVEFTKEIVSIKSLTCEEGDCAKVILRELEKMPIDEAFIDAAGNVVGVIRGIGNGPNILLNGHMDVVPEGTLEKWAPYKPFEPVIEDGKMYGRGTCDMKAGLAATLYGFKAVAEYLNRTGNKLSGDLIYSAVVQEEPAEMFGMIHLMDETLPEKNLSCDCVLLAEPTEGDIYLGQRGKIELVCRTFGKSVHSSVPWEGESALEMMNLVLDAIYSGESFNLEPDPRFGRIGMAVTNISVKPGGNLSTIPDYCEIAIDRRFSTSQTVDDLLAEFEALFEKCKAKMPSFNAVIEPRYFEETSWTGLTKTVQKWHPSWLTPRDNPFAEMAFEALESIGLTPKENYWVGGTDGSYSSAILGIPTVGYAAVSIKTAHREQEHITLDELKDSYAGYVAMLAKIYGINLAEFD